MKFLVQRGFDPLQPPYFMKKEQMSKVAQLSEFDETLYHVGGSNSTPKGEDEDAGGAYMIATSEQPICAYHAGDRLNTEDLPIKYAGFSTCFRKEAGKHGKDTWGIFRVHQFDKVEQFILCAPEESEALHEQLRVCSEDFLQSLGLPYQVVNIVSGDLNNAAAKKYDIEAWFPGYGEYKELVSCSNCTDYQSRATDTKMGQGDAAKHVHMLNSTLCALGRTICCILENYQGSRRKLTGELEYGVQVPEVLIPYMMDGSSFLPFVREASLDLMGKEERAKARETNKAKQGKKGKKNAEEKKKPEKKKEVVKDDSKKRRHSSFKVGGNDFPTEVKALIGKDFKSLEDYSKFMSKK